MPQGKLKAKVKVPQASRKKAKHRKPKGPKKGGESGNIEIEGTNTVAVAES